MRKDASGMSAVLADDYVLVHMTGRRQGKQEFLQCVTDGTLACYDEAEESCSVHVDGDVAQLVGESLAEASPFGARRSTWRLRQEIGLERCHGRWLMTKAVASMY